MSRLKMTMMAGTALTALALAAPAQADMITINSILSGWQNVVGGTNVNINNQDDQAPDTVSWGDPVAPNTQQSAYIFDPRTVPFDAITAPPPNSANVFSLGTFTHNNFVIAGGTSITSVDLAFSVGGVFVPSPLAATFLFTHDETPNETPCADPASPTPCNDFVTISNAFFNTPIMVGTEDFFFTLLGFSQDGGATITNSFSTIENQANVAELYAVITDTPFIVTPEPLSLSLLGLGLFGLGVAARRRR